MHLPGTFPIAMKTRNKDLWGKLFEGKTAQCSVRLSSLSDFYFAILQFFTSSVLLASVSLN